MHAPQLPRMTPDEFLAWERGQTERHAYYRGEIFAMSGGSPRHSNLASRIGAQLLAAVKGMPCDTHTADLKLALDEKHFCYADAAVVCRPYTLRPGTTDVVTNPRIVVEVLSPSTEAYDRGAKQAGYLALPSLQNFVLVSQKQPRVEVYTREGDGSFLYRVYEAGSIIRLPSIDAAIPVDDLYAGVFDVPGEDG